MHPRNLALLVAVVAIVTVGALAGPARAEATAKERYERGTTLYDLGRYREAAHEYEGAFELKNDAALLYNIGQAYRLAGDHADAIRAYRAYLRRLPQAPNRNEVDGQITRLAALVEQQRRAETAPPTEPIRRPTDDPPPATSRTNSDTTTAPATTTTPAVASASTAATTPSAPRPIYTRWWLWTSILVVVAAGGAVGGGVAATTPRDAPIPSGAYTVSF